ncbi:AAA family ATPase [Psychrobacter frigidicola]|uniref:RecBCD enzyme subunit RecB n=1 Tax=Psychrobacter frigidicola TaxID=45611 RepID=A0A5C7A5C9_9GAMM|nr:UvrD-helicase domain-containing protein [Psychrobacter frigidicola]TXD97810.1 AAA family ATPase [Psychrobacter frigidicola]
MFQTMPNNNNENNNTHHSEAVETTSRPHTHNQQPPQKLPAVRVPLNGKYLIEASAGTGKTWTLTGIVLRLLIEAKRAPEHIIATTFTRAAAAEMRERIHARLVDFYQLLQWLNKLQANPETHDILYPQLIGNSAKQHKKTLISASHKIDDEVKSSIKVSPEQRQAREVWLERQASLAGYADLMTDPINSHLLTYLLDNTERYPFIEAIRRTALVLTTLDKLFVGTLDSLSQKWLSEYSAETGYQQGMQISDHEQIVIESIIHDKVRAFHSQMYHQQPEIYALLQHTNRLTAPADHLSVAQKSLQFISTPIETVELGDAIDFEGYQQALARFKNCDLKDVEPYFDKDYRKAQGFTGNASLGTKADRIISIQSAIQQYDMTFFEHLDTEAQKFYDALPHAFLSKEEGGKGFNKGKEAERLAFINLESIQALKALHDYAEHIERYLDSLIEILNRNIALTVRDKLPAILEARRETTFALQMVRLNQALSGKQGERLARYIRHHYPVALIDESQDINGEQARMIERIYINQDHKDAKEASRSFLLLVGDPKQAIYGFRGGDVANYNAMKAHFDNKNMMSLDVNRRSNERLITALNHWFGRSNPTINAEDMITNDTSASQSADQLAQLGKSIYYQHITAANTNTRVSWQQPVIEQGMASSDVVAILPDSPVSVIHLPYNKEAKYNACELTALHIAALLASQQTIEGRPLKPSDIGVLGRRKQELKQVEDMLTKLGVPTLETAETNVFDTVIAADLVALLEAMLRPYRRDIINRVLTSHLYQLSLDEVQALMLSVDADVNNTEVQNPDSEPVELKQRYHDFQTYLKTAANHWQHGGILSALHYVLAYNPMATPKEGKQGQSLWVGLAGLEDGARYLMDLRHLLDILAQHGMHIGEHELLAWYKKNMNSKHTPEWAKQQPLPTESGVQLMTIHKSKGLEFPVVYVVGMDGASPKAGSRNKHNLYLYDHDIDNERTERRLSASAGQPHSKSAKGELSLDYCAQFETTENYEELRRLAYVAFTRASEQLYIVLSDVYSSAGAERKPILKWLDGDNKDKAFTLPERLQDQIGWVEYQTIETAAEAVITTNKQDARATHLSAKATPNPIIRIDYQQAYDQLQHSYFKGWAKTSFTALSRQLSEQSQALAIFDDGIEDELDITDSIIVSENNSSSADQNDGGNGSIITADDIRFRFVKGANAGTFLHQVFEKIDFNNKDKWTAIIDQGIRQYQLPLSYTSAEYQERLQPQSTSDLERELAITGESIESIADNASLAVAHDDLIAWVADVLAAPLLASGQPLQALVPKQRIAELGFNMGLAAGFTPEGINDAFTEHLPDEPEKHIQLTSQYSDYIYRYLRGEIDLVYEYAGKYYVVDYKSNYLGNSLSNYNNESLSAAMNKAGYWLQAAIYQVALHRFLRLRLQNYEGNETQYLGAVEYVFLRGIDSQGLHNYGRIQWQIPFALVDALDKLFGKPTP